MSLKEVLTLVSAPARPGVPPERVADAFFTIHHDHGTQEIHKKSKPQGLLGRTLGTLKAGLFPPAPTHGDSLSAACESLRDLGFSNRQVGVFLSVVTSKVREYLDFLAEDRRARGEQALDLNFSNSFFLGVTISDRRLDACPGPGKDLQTAIRRGMEELHVRLPDAFSPEEPPAPRLLRQVLDAYRHHPL